MSTVVVGDPPPELEQLLERRRQMGADRRDEIWEGVLHMAPAAHGRHGSLQAQVLRILGPHADTAGLRELGEFNLGEPEDYRVPDGGLRRPAPEELYNPTAALVVEIVSPGDETWKKLPFYANRGVDELLIADPEKRTIDWLALRDGEYGSVERSGLIELGPRELAERVDWP